MLCTFNSPAPTQHVVSIPNAPKKPPFKRDRPDLEEGDMMPLILNPESNGQATWLDRVKRKISFGKITYTQFA